MIGPALPPSAVTIAHAVAWVTSALAIAGIGYFAAAIFAARVFLAGRSKPKTDWAPGVSVLKSLKGVDLGMFDAFSSHCRQAYAGQFELLFGVSSLEDPAAAVVEQLKAEFPEQSIRLIECAQRLGTNGKVSTLAQLAPHAKYDFLLVNDSDITVGPRYLERVMAGFGSHPAQVAPPVGLVTALYRGRAHRTLASRFEALGIATDFIPAVLLAKLVEGGMHYGLGSTLAVRREALERIGGFAALLDYLADDYELGSRVAKMGYRVELSSEVVETNIAAYNWRDFAAHQVRWLRTVRDARPGGYLGLMVTQGLGWALLDVLSSGGSPLSMWLLGLSFFLRLALAMTVGAGVLADHQVLPSLWVLPLRDLTAMGLWVAGFAGDTIVWRGEQFRVKGGKLQAAQK